MAKGRKPGKVLEKLWYNHDGHSIQLELRMVTKESKYLFAIYLDNPYLHVERPSAEEAKRDAWTLLAESLKVTWQRMLCIYTETQQVDNGMSEGVLRHEIGIEVEQWDIGKTSTGEWCHRRCTHTARDGSVFTYPASNGLPHLIDRAYRIQEREEGMSEDERAEGVGTASMILDTPENRERIDVIAQGFMRLGEQLKRLMRQDQIVITLRDMHLLALPYPERT